jgi:hypothetical protein
LKKEVSKAIFGQNEILKFKKKRVLEEKYLEKSDWFYIIQLGDKIHQLISIGITVLRLHLAQLPEVGSYSTSYDTGFSQQ